MENKKAGRRHYLQKHFKARFQLWCLHFFRQVFKNFNKTRLEWDLPHFIYI